MFRRWLRSTAFVCAALAAAITPGCSCDSDSKDDPPPPLLTILSLSPVQGSISGGVTVTILGRDFAVAGGVDSVSFAGTAGTGLTVIDDARLTVVTPLGSPGPADVVVNHTALAQSATESNGFTYLSGPAPAPTIAAVTPAGGPTLGGTVVTILGNSFQSGATVDFGGVAASGEQVLSAGRLTCVAPPGSVGAVTVLVTNPDLQTDSLASGYTYSNTPVVTGISPTGGLTDGGNLVTVSGVNFVVGATVDLGGAPLTITLFTPTSIEGTTAPRGPGDVGVRVCNPGGVCGTGSVFAYRYGPNSQTTAFVFDTATGIDCRRRWFLDFRLVPVQTDLFQVGLQTTSAVDIENQYALDWFRGYVLSAVNQIYGRNSDGTGISGSSINTTFVGLTPASGSPGCAVPASDYSRQCIGGCAPTSATGCTMNPAGCSGPTVGLSLFDNLASQPCGAAAEDNCTASQYGGSGCRGIFVRDIAALWGGALTPQLAAGDRRYLDGTTLFGTRYNAIHTALQQLAYRVALVVAHETAHSMGLVAGPTTSPCTTATGLCSATTAHNDCCTLNVMRSFTTFAGTFTPSSRYFSGRSGSPVVGASCFQAGSSSWSQLTSFIGTSP